MPVKPIFGSYPYLTIAKRFGVPYRDVLMLAEAVRDRGVEIHFGLEIRGVNIITLCQHIFQNMRGESERKDFAHSVELAVKNFNAIVKEGWDQS